IIPDLPYEENADFMPVCEKYGIDLIQTVALTSGDRVQMIAREAKGFINIVASVCKPDSNDELKRELEAIVADIRKVTDVPCAIELGIDNPNQAAFAASLSDGAILGSALVEFADIMGNDRVKAVGKFVRIMKEAL
nr:tryptophan synthase subunit alpha [Clostridia bacterium]